MPPPFVSDGFVADGFVGEEVAVSPFLSNRLATAQRGDCLLELYLLDLNGDEHIIRVSRRGTSTKTKDVVIGTNTLLANQTYLRKLLQYPEIKESAWDGNSLLSPITAPNTYTFKIKNTDGSFDYLEDYTWEGQRFVAYFLDSSNLSDGIKLCEGVLATPDFSLNEITVYGKSKEFAFDAPITTHKYRGTGYGLELSGVKTIAFGSPSKVNITGNLTLEGWFWLEALPAVDTRIWGWGSSLAGSPWGLVLKSTGGVSLRGVIGGVQEVVDSVVTMGLRKFYHLEIVINGRDVNISLWDNDTQTLTEEITISGFTSSIRDSQVGNTYNLSSASTLQIWYDDLRVWNTVRTKSERASNRDTPITGNVSSPIPANLVHYIKLDEGTGTTVADSSATPADGTISGAGTHTWIWMCEGGPELANVEKQDIWGKRFGVKPTLVKAVTPSIYSVGPGPYESIEVYEGGLLIAQNADAGTLRNLILTTPAGGTNTPLLSRGLFKLGSKPEKPISCIVKGYNGGVNGYIETIPELVREISTTRGKLSDPGDIDVDSFDALGTVETAVVGVSSLEIEGGGESGSGSNSNRDANSKTIGKLIGKLMQSTGGRSGFLDSKLFVERFSGAQPSPSRVLKKFLRIPTCTSPEMIIYGVKVLYHRNDVVLSTSDLSQTVVGTSDWHQWTVDYLEEYSEDGELREKYEGKGGDVLTLTTCLYNSPDAKSLANRILPIIKGKRSTWEVLVPESEAEIQVGDTVALEYRLPNKSRTPRLKMDGTIGLWVLQKEHSRMTGSIMFRLWG